MQVTTTKESPRNLELGDMLFFVRRGGEGSYLYISLDFYKEVVGGLIYTYFKFSFYLNYFIFLLFYNYHYTVFSLQPLY